MKKILYIQPIHAEGMDWLRQTYEVTVANSEDREVLKEAVKDASAIVTRLTEVDQELIDAGKKLEAIAKNGIGVDNVDVNYATKRGIAVLTTGAANSRSVAEHTMFAIGALYKRLAYFNSAMHSGNWGCRDDGGFTDVEGQTLGLVGMGRIGSELASMAQMFRMQVLVYDPFQPMEKIQALGCTQTQTLEELLCQADVVSLHLPLTKDNAHMMNQRTFSLMKPNAFFINFARGGLVDEDALYQALTGKRIAGAALDAFSPEPPNFNHPLYQMDQVILSPHTGGISEAARKRMSMQVAKGIDDVLCGRIPECCANKQELYC